MNITDEEIIRIAQTLFSASYASLAQIGFPAPGTSCPGPLEINPYVVVTRFLNSVGKDANFFFSHYKEILNPVSSTIPVGYEFFEALFSGGRMMGSFYWE